MTPLSRERLNKQLRPYGLMINKKTGDVIWNKERYEAYLDEFERVWNVKTSKKHVTRKNKKRL